jgi:hypothetical protein
MTERLEHLTPDEIELWAQGLLPVARAMHLAGCPDCLATAERERKLFVQLAQLERFAPSAEFAERVMARVRLPTPSGDFKS